MRAEVVAVGSELLLGETVDTNTPWIAARLAEIGVDVHRHTTVGDNVARIGAVLGEAVRRADVVIVTGGLGPTQDDVTREAVAAVAGVGLVRDPALVAHLRAYFARARRAMPERNLVQADIPAGARVLAPVGTAAGFVVDVPAGDRGDAGAGGGGLARTARVASVYCVPGVPREMRDMVSRDVVPDLAARGGLATTVSRVVRTAGLSESSVAEAAAGVVERLEAAGNPTVAFLASGGETRVRVTAKADSRPQALRLIEPVVAELVEALGAGVVGVDDEDVEHAVARLLGRRGWTLAVAESVTGGGVGARLVRVPGASAWFRGGLVVYSSAGKEKLAGVPREMLAQGGPVSEDVALALSGAARRRLEADVAVAVVGVAGPQRQGGQPVGTVCVAVALPDGQARAHTVRLPERERTELQGWAAAVALDYLRRQLARAEAQGSGRSEEGPR